MKSALPLLPLVPLLLVTMGVGPCGSQPLGSVDGGGPGDGSIKEAGSPTDARDGGPTDGPSICVDPVSGQIVPCPTSGTVCTYEGKSYPNGASFTTADGCNTCGCDAITGVTCTHRTCLDASTDAVPFETGGDGPSICNSAGITYQVGASFVGTDGCNTCTCEPNGIVCTKKACLSDGGVAEGGVITGACKLGQDQTCNEDPTISVLRGKCQPDSSCLCSGASPNGVVSPYTGRCLGPDDTTGLGCEYFGKLMPVGSTFACSDGCSACTCAAPGKIATASTTGCPDGGASTCNLDATYVYGNIGGLVAYQDEVTISPTIASSGTMPTYVLHRMVPGASMGPSCAPPFPSCGDPAVIDVSDVMADILDPLVQKYLMLPSGSAMLFGLDTRPVDGPIFSFQRGDGHGFLVGAPCNGASNCSAPPAAITKLVTDLRALDAQQLASTSCAALSPSPTFACFSATCKSNTEYCARAVVNGQNQVSVCRPYPSGCTSCDCARKDAVSTLQVSICSLAAFTCSDGSPVAVSGSTSSPTLTVQCTVQQ